MKKCFIALDCLFDAIHLHTGLLRRQYRSAFEDESMADSLAIQFVTLRLCENAAT
jgi:hypothetical protein